MAKKSDFEQALAGLRDSKSPRYASDDPSTQIRINLPPNSVVNSCPC